VRDLFGVVALRLPEGERVCKSCDAGVGEVEEDEEDEEDEEVEAPPLALVLLSP
jgi:hypothetical protein